MGALDTRKRCPRRTKLEKKTVLEIYYGLFRFGLVPITLKQNAKLKLDDWRYGLTAIQKRIHRDPAH
ncbi:MAG: hypothetical protein ACXV3D_08485 [Halobacteriota archaeon]